MQQTQDEINKNMLWNAIKGSPRLAGFLSDQPFQIQLTHDEPQDIHESDLLPPIPPPIQDVQKDNATVENVTALADPGSLTQEVAETSPNEVPATPPEVIDAAVILQSELDQPPPPQKNLAIQEEAEILAALLLDTPAITGAEEAAPPINLPTVSDEVDQTLPPPPGASDETDTVTTTEESALPSLEPAINVEAEAAPTTQVEEIAASEKATETEIPASKQDVSEPVDTRPETQPPTTGDESFSTISRHGFSGETTKRRDGNLVWGIAVLAALVVLLATILMTWPTISQNFGFTASAIQQPSIPAPTVASPPIQVQPDAGLPTASPGIPAAAATASSVQPSPESASNQTQSPEGEKK